jgi:tRNA dimethylallyltransferase
MNVELVVICGPTGVGKTELSIELAKKIKGEIICADSRQIYKYLNIGTAKPEKNKMQEVPHHLFDYLEPDQEYSVAEYKKDVERIIEEIKKRGKIPILVGGTGLYIKAVVDGLSLKEVEKNKEIRENLKKIAEEKGNIFLHNLLKEKDEISSKKIHPSDLKRIIRALEVIEITGKKFSSFENNLWEKKEKYKTKMIGLICKRETLYKKIEERVEKMLEKGLVEEVKFLLKKGYSENLNSFNTIGYKQVVDFLKGCYNFEEMKRIIKRETKHYAKRQLTWFKKDKRIIWIDVENKRKEEILNEIEKIIEEE